MYRIFRGTASRSLLNLEQLNSHACFILVCDADRKIVAWMGKNAGETDQELTITLSVEILKRDLCMYDATEKNIDIIKEGEEKTAQLSYLTGKLWSDNGAYFRKVARAERCKEISNLPLTVAVVERFSSGAFGMRETGHILPDEHGKIVRANFPFVEVNSMVAINVGPWWDLWVARGASPSEEKEAKVNLLKYLVRFT
jgi:hypothetical protein